MPGFATLRDLPIKEGSKVLVRAPFDVPLKNGRVADDSRIREALPTIKYLLRKKAVVLLLSHLGRPQGVDESLRMDPVASCLERLLKQHVVRFDDCIGAEVEDAVNELHDGDVAVLENVRFHKEEELNDDLFARGIAELADFYVNDAFSVSHRSHASVVGIPKYLPAVAGFSLEREIAMLSRVLRPKKPFVVLLGGAKASDKIKIIDNLARRADKVLIGGAMANTFLKAQGCDVGKSLFEPGMVRLARHLLEVYGKKIVLPSDVVVAGSAKAKGRIVGVDNIPGSASVFDIGPVTVNCFVAELKKARTVLWNGPVGLFEQARFSKGTKALAQALARMKSERIVGGGDTVNALNKFRVVKKFTHVSSGGGAALEFFEGKKLPGIAALEESKKKFGL